MIFGVDISHWDGQVDFAKLAAAGCDFVGIKCTENGVLDPLWKQNVQLAQAAKMPFFGYPFLHASDTTNMMQTTFSALADAGCTIALDWETKPAPPSIVEAWMGAYEDKAQRQGLNYYGDEPLGGAATPKIGTWPRWFPEYNSTSRIPPCQSLTSTQDWRNSYLIWQYTATGAINGINGNVDFNHSAPMLTLPVFVNWLNTGSFGLPVVTPTPAPVVVAPTPKPTPSEAWEPPSFGTWQAYFGKTVTEKFDISTVWDIGNYYRVNYP